MIRTLSILSLALAAATAVAAPASALELTNTPAGYQTTVSLAGKDAKTIHSELVRAAYAVCAAELRGSLREFSGMDACMRQSVDRAMAAAEAISPRTFAKGNAQVASK
jgi:hypothetical protein